MPKHDWTRDELVLICEAVAARGWKAFHASSKEAWELSTLIRELSSVPETDRDPAFRSPESIQRKSYDIVTAASWYQGTPTKGGSLTRKVVVEYEANPELIDVEARALRLAAAPVADGPVMDLDDELAEAEAREGRAMLVAHYRRERNRPLRQAKLQFVLASGGQIRCEVCGFSFGARYGELGEGFVEVHHVLPLHASGETITRLQDLALLCSNCHRMIHRARPWLTPAELRSRLQPI